MGKTSGAYRRYIYINSGQKDDFVNKFVIVTYICIPFSIELLQGHTVYPKSLEQFYTVTYCI